MRSLTIAAVVGLGLLLGAVRPATGQEAVRLAPPAVEAVVPDSAPAPKAEAAQAVPQLPALVPSVSRPLEPAPAAPKGNLVIPVTTALIVLAALVLILLID